MEAPSKRTGLGSLFWAFFKVSLFVVGGGYVIIAVVDRIAAKRKWTQEGEVLDLLPVFQMVPGLIATHCAIYVGRKTAGAWGAVVAAFAVALPSVVIFSFVAAGYERLPLDNPLLHIVFAALRCYLTWLIAKALWRSGKRNLKDAFSWSVMLLALSAIVVGVPIYVVLLAAIAVGLVRVYSPLKRRYLSSFLPLLVFLKYGLLCFGGGFVLVPMYLEDFVGETAPYLQVTEGAFANLMALTQMTPGPIGVNGATYFGYCLAGVPGALLASIALLLPGSLLAYAALASLDRFKSSKIVRGILTGVRPASIALMLVALWAFARRIAA